MHPFRFPCLCGNTLLFSLFEPELHTSLYTIHHITKYPFCQGMRVTFVVKSRTRQKKRENATAFGPVLSFFGQKAVLPIPIGTASAGAKGPSRPTAGFALAKGLPPMPSFPAERGGVALRKDRKRWAFFLSQYPLSQGHKFLAHPLKIVVGPGNDKTRDPLLQRMLPNRAF